MGQLACIVWNCISFQLSWLACSLSTVCVVTPQVTVGPFGCSLVKQRGGDQCLQPGLKVSGCWGHLMMVGQFGESSSVEACPPLPKFLCFKELRNALVVCSSFSLVLVRWYLSCHVAVGWLWSSFMTTHAAFTFTPRDTVKVSARDWGMGRYLSFSWCFQDPPVSVHD